MVRKTALAVLLFAAPAFGQSNPYVTTVPTDTDLKAAFCIGYWSKAAPVDENLGSTDQTRASLRNFNRQVADAQGRLRAYLLPKTAYLDADALTLAMEQGDAARNRGRDAPGDCLRSNDFSECDALSKKMETCLKADFLPF